MSEIEQMIVDCIKRKSKLSEWEDDFISSIYGRSSLTLKQIERLEMIWDKATAI